MGEKSKLKDCLTKSICNAREPGSIPELGRSPGEGIGYPSLLGVFFYQYFLLPVFLGFPCGSASEASACNVGDLGLIPGLRRSPGEGKGYPLQCSGLENPVDCICIAHGVTESWTWLRDSHLTTKAKKTNTPQWNHFLFWIQIQQSKKLLPTDSHISYQDFQIFIWAWEAASFPNIMFNITLKNKMERLSP